MISQNAKFPSTARSPGKSDHQAIHCPTALDHYRGATPLTPSESLCLILIRAKVHPSDSECSALTRFSMSLARKYVYLKELYNQDIKE